MRFFRDALLAFLAACLTFGILEGVLRLAHVRFEASFFDADNERGYALRPGSEGWYLQEGETYIKINSDGMRDIERPADRPPHTLRVAVIGSSEAEANQVPFEETFETSMTRELSNGLRKYGWQADVLNFGTDGYTPVQSYLTLQNHVWKYHPQIVVFLFSAWTVQKAVRDFYPRDLGTDPVWVLKDGKLVPDELMATMPHFDEESIRRRGRIMNMMNRSYLLALLHEAVSKAMELPDQWQAKLQKQSKVETKPEPKEETVNGVTMDFVRSFNPARPELKQAWAVTEAVFQAMKQECDQHGVEFWIVPADQAMQVEPDTKEREDFARRLGMNTLDASDERVERFGAAHGIPVFSPGPLLRDYAVSHHTFVHGSISPTLRSHHWNKIGQDLGGRFIARQLLKESQVVQSLNDVKALLP